jgi:hypothetical protein
MLTAEYVRERLLYDPETGIFTWRNGPRAGKQAGWANRRGYIVICVDDINQYGHRLAWLYVTGELPSALIDHRDQNRGNNRFANLREAGSDQNQFNRGKSRTSKSGIKGVFQVKGRWLASIRAGAGRRFYLGSFDTKEMAAVAYADAALRLHGEFSHIPGG